jgi:hypothetical protein
MHLDRTNNASKNNCENANTHAHGVDHLVVLAHLQRWCWSRCSLSGREGLGSSLPPTERASAGFRRFRGNEMPIFYYAGSRKSNGDQTEANGGHSGDRTLDRTRSLFDRTRPVSVQCLRVFQLFDRTRPVVQGAYWTPTGCGHCGVRSELVTAVSARPG